MPSRSPGDPSRPPGDPSRSAGDPSRSAGDPSRPPGDPSRPPGDPSRPPGGTVTIPALLRAARGSYGHAVAASLHQAGFDDVPRNGPFVLGGMANRGWSASDMVAALEVTKQAASQLIDTLVVRGYLTREVNPEDRRRLTVDLTDRGRAAAASVRAAVESVDVELAGMISPEEMAGLRAGLAALAEIKDRRAHQHQHN